MRPVCAGVSEYVWELLQRPGRYTVCAGFARVLDLAQGETVLSLQDPSVPPTPLSLILERESFLLVQRALRPGLEFHSGGGRLHWDGREIEPRAEQRFSCQMTVARGRVRPVPYRALRRAAALFARPESLAFAADPELSAWAGGELTPVQRRAACQLEREGPEALLGLGGGLTPAGDDLLVGALAALAWLGAAGDFSRLAAAAEPRLEQTGLISRAFLRRALEREFSQPVLALFSALDGGSEQDLLQTAARLCSVGHTSGSDLLGGVLWALRRDLKQEGIA